VRVAVLSEFPEGDVAAFSGIPYYMERELARHVEIVHVQTSLPDLGEVFHDLESGERQLREAGFAASSALRTIQADVVLCQGSSMIPFLERSVPVVLWHDSTWHTLLQMDFDEFAYGHPLLLDWDRRVLARCDHVVYAAEWVFESTMRHYDVAPEKLSVMPFGASLDEPSRDDIVEAINARAQTTCELTFIGYDWIRKGLPLASSVVSGLKRRNVNAVLNVVGPTLGRAVPPASGNQWQPANQFDSTSLLQERLASYRYLRPTGPLYKSSETDVRTLRSLLARTQFLLHPASFECFGVAMAEALAFGVPVLALAGHGAATIVRDDACGMTFGPAEFVEGAIEWILRRLDDRSRYVGEALGAYDYYCSRLSWRQSCRNLVSLMARLSST
jgi:glycosyltransferase involved in cell wall biosynthesis